MKEAIGWAFGWLFAAVTVSAICVAATYSCVSVNERYYDGMKTCLQQGGSWVPQSQGSYSSSCINPHSTK